MIKFKTIILAALGFTLLSSCGGKGGEPITASSAATVLGTLNTQFSNLPRSNTVPSLPGAGSVAPLSIMAVACETIEPAAPTDIDSDSIATYKKYTFNCVDHVSGGNTVTYSGSTTVRDLDETSLNKMGLYGGLSAEFSIPSYKSVETATGTAYEYAHEGFWNYKNVDGALTSNSSYKGKNKYKSGNFNNDYTYLFTWNTTMTPTSNAQPWTVGAISMKGTFELNGLFVVEVGGVVKQQQGSWVISYYSKDLLYQFDGTCTKFYKSGSMFMEDSTNVIEYRYNCNSAKVYVNGVESDWLTL